MQDKMQHNQENVEGKCDCVVCVSVSVFVHKKILFTENEWYKRYSEQAAINSQLSQQISQLEAQLMNAREGVLNINHSMSYLEHAA